MTTRKTPQAKPAARSKSCKATGPARTPHDIKATIDAPRIVFVSMHDGPDYRTAANGLGALAYIGKSDLTAELPPLLHGLLGGFKPEVDL